MATPARTYADRLRWMFWLANRIETLEARFLGFSGMSLMRRTPVLVLQTVGRRTGKRRRVALAYWEKNGTYRIGGGAGGMTKVDWVANLRAMSAATIWVRRRRIDVAVHEFTGEDYENARAEAFERWPGAPKYERISGRPIPYFELRPIS